MKKLILVLGLIFCAKPVLAYFYPETYKQSQKRFIAMVDSFKDIPGVEHYHLRVPTQTRAELYMDGLYLPQQGGNKEHLVIVTSGIHGVETFTGAAIQIEFLSQTFDPQWLEKTGFLFIHAVNPFGFHFLRRVDEANVDLNRNVSGSPELFQKFSQDYKDFEPYLNPNEKLRVGLWADTKLFLKSLMKLITHGKKRITQISVGGQYQNPKGIYYGGNEVRPNSFLVQFMFEKAGKNYSKILHIDLHTGFGERGRLHFFSGRHAMELPGFSEVFNGFDIDAGSDDDFYETSGNFEMLTIKAFHDREIVIPMTFEFGTMNSQTIMGGFRSLRNMIYENQGHQHGYASQADKQTGHGNFLEMFNPSDKTWRDQVLKTGTSTLKTVVTRFSEI